jgi:NAD(P)-dependent dehydrogenase (short-subunit alcohol dehydrogenase family)
VCHLIIVPHAAVPCPGNVARTGRRVRDVDLGLVGAKVVVTGGTKGMGRAIAECYAEEGAEVAVLARGQEALDETVAALRQIGSADPLGLATDMTNAGSITASFAAVGERWGSLNVLVNTVGPGAATFEDLTDQDWDAALNIGTMAAVRAVREALPLLEAAPWARIVNISAHSIQRQSPMLVAYTASKAALTSVSKNLAKSLAPKGILVNTVSPGSIVTASFSEGLRPVFEEAGLDPTDPYDVMRWIDENFHHPADLGRAGLPREIATVVTFLGSQANGYATGVNVNVDGGSDFI